MLHLKAQFFFTKMLGFRAKKSLSVFWRARRASQNTITSKHSQQYYTKKRLIRDLLSNIPNFKRHIYWALFDIKSKNIEQCIKSHYIALNVHSV